MERILHPPQSVRSAVALIGKEFDFLNVEVATKFVILKFH